jgi:CHAT domain-containing protein
MLFVHAEPIGQSSVAWQDIMETIEREFQARLSDLPKTFELDVVQGETRDSFLKAIEKKHYDILHFAGHGQINAKGFGELLLKNSKTGKSDPISAPALGTLLENKRLRLVVLSACSTSAGDFAKEFAVVAKSLVEYHVPAVVANQFPITNSAAATFAGSFYNKLLQSGNVDLATTAGRLALAFMPPASGQARFEWGIPTIYRHIGAARVFKV